MAYSINLLPKSATYYSVSNAYFEDTLLHINSGGYAEIQISRQLIASFTRNMLVVAHASVMSNGYVNDAVQITISLVDSVGNTTEYLVPIQYSDTGVFNTAITLPETTNEIVSATYTIHSAVPAIIYNWELCAEDDEDVSVIIDGVEQALPRLLYDYNTYAYAVGQKETTVGLITCYLKDATDLQGHFTISFFATERCNVHVRIKDNGITELYTPQVYTVERGYASVSIPHAYLKKLATDHNFQVTIQCTNGQLSVPVRGVLYTIDGGYLATRLLDPGIDTIDIGIRQLEKETKPSEIWALGFESRQLILKKASYGKASEWTAMKDFGEMLTGAVEFAGYWQEVDESLKYTMKTEVQPHVALVDANGVLKVLYGNNFEEYIEIASGVTDVSMCQGFNSLYYTEQDQGLLLAYIQDGTVYYVQRSNTTKEWSLPSVLYDSVTATRVRVHRLPDYRVGICIEYADGAKWLISSRTYVGQSVKTEKIRTYPSTAVACTILDTDHLDHPTSVTPTFESLTPEARFHKQVKITFAYPIVYAFGSSERKLTDNFDVYIDDEWVYPITVVASDNNAFIITLDTEYAGGRSISITARCLGVMLKMYNGTYAMPVISVAGTLPLPPFEVHESLSSDITPSITVVNRGIETTSVDAIERAGSTITSNIVCDVKETTEIPVDAYELGNTDITANIEVSVLQTGTTPI